MQTVNSPFSTLRSFDILRNGAPARLAKLRKDAAKLAANPHRNMQVAANPDWRTVRYSRFDNVYPAACPGFNGKSPILSAFSADALPVRGIVFADEVSDARIDHTGWYADAHCSEKARGIVASLPHGRYLSGYLWTSNGEHVLYTGPGDIFDNAKDAARAADGYAESFADDAREDSERFEAMQDAEENAESALKAFRKEYALRHHSAGSMDDAREALQELRQARETLREATAAYERG